MSNTPEFGVDRLQKKPGMSPWIFVIGGIFALACMAGAIIMPILASEGRNVADTNCKSNLQSIASAALFYASENDDRLPIKGWDKSLRKFQPDLLVYACPVQRRIDPRSSGYALSEAVAGKELSTFESLADQPFFFDSAVTQPGMVDKASSKPRPGRHDNGRSNNTVFLDGHIESDSLN